VRPGVQATAMLRAALEAQNPPAREITLWRSTVAAAEAIESAILGSGDIADSPTPLSPNLLSDVPADVRARRLTATLAEVGGLADTRPPIAERLAWAVSAAHLAWTIPGAAGEIECRIELTPTTPAMVQRLEIAVREPVTASSSVTRHYRPVLPA